MRILRVVTLASRTGRYGGPFDTAREQVRALNESGVAALLLAGTLAGDAPYDEESFTKYSQVRPLLPHMRFSALMSLQLLRQLVRSVKHSTVVHVSFCREAIPIAAALIAVIMRRKLILQPHGMLVGGGSATRRAFDAVLIRPLLRRADAVLALTALERSVLVDCYLPDDASVHLLGNPIRREFSPIPTSPSAPRSDALFIARLHIRKNPMLFAGAAVEAGLTGRHTVYRIVGPDDGQRDLVRQVAASCHNLVPEDGIPPSDIPDYIAACRVFVVCSTDEPWGNLLIGALAQGKPVVVTRSCALSPDVEKSKAGIVVSDDSALDLHRAIEKLLEDKAFYEECSLNATELANEIASPIKLHAKLRTDIYAQL